MFARITKYRIRAEAIDTVRAELDRVKDEIMALPGLKQFVNVLAEDGSGYAVALVDTREPSPLGRSKIEDLWARFSVYLEAPPTVESFAVVNDWKN